MMEINDFIKKFAGQFEDTDEALFSSEMSFRDLDEWSSFLALSIMAMVEEEYEVELTASDITGSATIEDLFKVVTAKKDV